MLPLRDSGNLGAFSQGEACAACASTKKEVMVDKAVSESSSLSTSQKICRICRAGRAPISQSSPP